MPRVEGRVLEIGTGSGHNFPHIPTDRLEPSEALRKRAIRAASQVNVKIELLPEPAEALTLADGSVDTVLTTFTLCTIGDLQTALAQAARVLAPGGSLVFCEHGRAPDEGVARWQRRLDPLWKRLSGGCHLGRPIPALLQAAGFEIVEMETGYIPGWRPACFNYWGLARRS